MLGILCMGFSVKDNEVNVWRKIFVENTSG